MTGIPEERVDVAVDFHDKGKEYYGDKNDKGVRGMNAVPLREFYTKISE